MPSLLLIACSSRKKQTPGLLMALDRYTGPIYQTIHKAKREGFWSDSLRVLILSAQYGLIDGNEQIAWYDRKMNRLQALEMQTRVGMALDTFLQSGEWQEVFLNVGRIYRVALETSALLKQLGQEGKVTEASGGIGLRRKQTREWLINVAQIENTVLSRPKKDIWESHCTYLTSEHQPCRDPPPPQILTGCLP